MPMGDPIGVGASRATANTGVIGRTGAGKSTLCKRLAAHLVDSGALVLVVDRKEERRNLATLPALGGRSTVFRLNEAIVSPLQPPEGAVDLLGPALMDWQVSFRDLGVPERKMATRKDDRKCRTG